MRLRDRNKYKYNRLLTFVFLFSAPGHPNSKIGINDLL